jgi:phosphonate transport system substrate-binding protein
MVMMARGWRMDLPPSLGREPMRARARELAALLYDVGFGMVATAESYAVLEQRLVSGEADAAWGPPLVCARAESAGGRVVLRGVRDGAATYRSVLVARNTDTLNLSRPGPQRRRPRAAWVDPSSMAGYLLPRAFLRSLDLDPAQFLVEEHLLGSYEACLLAVLEGRADLTATFAGPEGTMGDGFVTLTGRRAIELRAVAYTAECPNDGVVLSPRLSSSTADEVQAALRELVAKPSARAVLASAMAMTGFEEPPPGAYLPVLEIAAAGA